MPQGEKILIVLIALLGVAIFLGLQKFPPKIAPAFNIAPVDDPHSVILGASTAPATNTTLAGPRELTANKPLFFPPPLAHLNPTTSDELLG